MMAGVVPAAVRMRLQRSRGFNLQATSRAMNGLPARAVGRGTRFGNPFALSLLRDAGIDVSGGMAAQLSVDCFDAWLTGTSHRLVPTVHRMAARRVIKFGATIERRDQIIAALPDIRGHNLACWCQPGVACHADVLLRLANGAAG